MEFGGIVISAQARAAPLVLSKHAVKEIADAFQVITGTILLLDHGDELGNAIALQGLIDNQHIEGSFDRGQLCLVGYIEFNVVSHSMVSAGQGDLVKA